MLPLCPSAMRAALPAAAVFFVTVYPAAAAEFEGRVEPFLGAPRMDLAENVFLAGRFPNIAVAVDGTLLAVWGRDVVRLRRSEDGGLNWGPPITIAEPGFMGGGVTVDEGTGDILAFVEDGHPPSEITVYRSRDHGKTWAAQETEIAPDSNGNLPSMHMNEHGITLRHGEHAGRLVRPSRWYAGRNHRDLWPEHYTNAIYSDDGGATWQTSEPFPENGTGEACIVELSDGRLLYNSRVHWDARPKFNRRRAAISEDGGATWGGFRIVEALPDGQQQRSYGCMGGMCRLPVEGEDIILFSNIDTPNPRRERATVWASFDGGDTWPVKRLVHDGPSGYSSMVAGRPGTASEGWIYLMFESAGAKVARFNLSWLIAGERTGDGEVPEALRGRGPAGASGAAGAPDFATEVLPVLSNKCFACHGPDAEDDELRLDSRAAATVDLGGYRAIDPADLGQSELVFRIHDAGDPMPPAKAEKQLTDAERDLLTRWVKAGGDYAQHWAFVPPIKARPHPREAAIDTLVRERLGREGIAPPPAADKATLARRAALVLTGLPPEPEQLETYLADASPDAYGKLVDALLASPRYGEHQARYWLDAVRYGDTHGLHLDNKRGIYPYRDWVVKAYNENLPLDRFLIYQIAGDMMQEGSMGQLVATGFVRMNPTTAEGGAIPAEFQAKNNFDRVETIGTALLGMTFNCARCHTHKYDPVTQDDYYALMAFFNSTAEAPLDGNKYDYAPAVKAPSDAAGWAAVDAWEREADEVLSQYKKLVGTKVEQLRYVADPESKLANRAGAPRAAELLERWAELEKGFTTTLVARELDRPRETRLLHRGEYDQPRGEALAPAVPPAMGALPEGAPANRLGLARWFVADDNPLVARVLVNRMWASVFGEGLVRTPEDFGLQGEQPTHPELLDWLAVDLRESGWDMKAALRLLVTSEAFKADAARRPGVEDPANRLLARGPSFRLDAEVIRDSALWAGELLDPTMGGEGVKPYQPPGMWSALMHPASNTKNYVPDEGPRVYRRGLYVYWKRTSPHPMMTLFDAPSRESSCVRRSRSSTPTQSLALLNEPQRLQAANGLAARLLREAGGDAARLDRLYRLIACRPPNGAERAACETLLDRERTRYAADPGAAAELLKAGDCGRGAELDPAEHAAWAQLAAVVLASDAALLLY